MHVNMSELSYRSSISVQVDAFCRSQPGLKVIGYYHANELLRELDLKPVARRVADKIQQQQGHAVILLVRHCAQPAVRTLLLAPVHLHERKGSLWKSVVKSVQVDNSKLGAFADSASQNVLQASSLRFTWSATMIPAV